MADPIVQNKVGAAPIVGRDIVTVGCTLPQGMRLNLEEMYKDETGKDVWRQNPEEFIELNGANKAAIINGVGLTQVPKEKWDRWFERNGKNLAAVKGGYIFVQSETKSAIDQARDHVTIKTKMEPIDPEKPGIGVQKMDKKEAA